MKKLGTYIGVCDFMTQAEVFAILDFFAKYKSSVIQLMIGTMTSFKVLNKLETKWAAVFPQAESLRHIFSSLNPQAINCIHYADYENNPGLADMLARVVEYCGDGLNAIQLDMIWPDKYELRKFLIKHPLPLVLQVSKKSMEQYSNNPLLVAEKIQQDYSGMISHVLLDCSMGKGKLIDVDAMVPYIKAIKEYTPDIQIAVAGGLGPGTVKDVAPLIKEYGVSIDAQSKLRHSGDAMHPIDWPLAEQYIEEGMECYLNRN